MSDTTTVLHPSDPTLDTPAVADLCQAINAVGLTGSANERADGNAFWPGMRFRELILFDRSLGGGKTDAVSNGSPEHQIGDAADYCAIVVGPATDDIEFLGVANTETPTCRCCGYKLHDWVQLITAWYDSRNTFIWICPGCNRALRPWQLDWHHTAGFGRITMTIWGIHAEPAPELLHALSGVTGSEWEYFHYHL